MNIRVRALPAGRSDKGAVTAAEREALLSDEFCGADASIDDIHVRRMLLCHDQYDRAYERFPKAYLSQFAKTLPGKSVMPGHDYGELPLGRFFNAGVTKRQEAAFPVPSKSDGAPGFKDEEREVNWLKAAWYFAAHDQTDALRQNIDLGVYKDVSIGFRFDDLICDVCQTSYFDYENCPHIIGRSVEDGNIVTGTYGGDASKAEALEGSIVFLGCQPQARLVRAVLGNIDPEAEARTPYGEDRVVLKEAEALARQFGYKRKVWAMGANDLPPFDAHCEAVLTAVERLTERAKLLTERRARDGRTVSDERKQVLASVRDGLTEVLIATEQPDLLAIQTQLLRSELEYHAALAGSMT